MVALHCAARGKDQSSKLARPRTMRGSRSGGTPGPRAIGSPSELVAFLSLFSAPVSRSCRAAASEKADESKAESIQRQGEGASSTVLLLDETETTTDEDDDGGDGIRSREIGRSVGPGRGCIPTPPQAELLWRRGVSARHKAKARGVAARTGPRPSASASDPPRPAAAGIHRARDLPMISRGLPCCASGSAAGDHDHARPRALLFIARTVRRCRWDRTTLLLAHRHSPF